MRKAKTIWYKCKEKLPQNPMSILDVKQYLCKTNYGYETFYWCDGWNCFPDHKEHEITSVIEWAEIPK